jgi:peptidoglycan/xylan/chitin deacetylase (PgdA/CDA1 family)
VTKIERAARFLSRSGAGAVLRRLPTWSGVLTFCFHRIGSRGDSAWERTLWDVTAEELDRRLTLIRRSADLIGPDDLLALDRIPRGRHVLLSFDDGYREWATTVLPVLRAHGVSAAFFLATGFIDRPRPPWWYELPWMVRHSHRRELPGGSWLDSELRFGEGRRDAAAEALLDLYKTLQGDRAEVFLDWVAEASGSGRCPQSETSEDWLTWEMARELRDAGMEIGGHTVDHPVLARLPGDRQRHQILACGRRIEAELERPMRMFSYPVGLPDSYGSEARAALREAGVSLAFGYRGGFARPGSDFDRLDLPRVTGGMNPDILRATLALPQRFARW